MIYAILALSICTVWSFYRINAAFRLIEKDMDWLVKQVNGPSKTDNKILDLLRKEVKQVRDDYKICQNNLQVVEGNLLRRLDNYGKKIHSKK